jgi:hypothetical protein
MIDASVDAGTFEEDPNANEASIINFSYGKSVAWTFIGIPWILWAIIRDSKDFWMHIFQETEVEDDTEVTKRFEIVNATLIKEFQMVLKTIDTEDTSVHNFASTWRHIHGEPVTDKEKETTKLVEEFVQQFQNSREDDTINIARMRRMLPKKLDYSDTYITRTFHINVPWIAKGVRKYQSKSGVMIIGGYSLHRKQDTGGGELDKNHLDSIDASVKDMVKKYYELTKSTQTIRQEIDTQNRLLTVLKEKKMQW